MKLPTSFRLPADLLNKLKIMSENSNKSVSDIVCNALINNFENENYFRTDFRIQCLGNIKNYQITLSIYLLIECEKFIFH